MQTSSTDCFQQLLNRGSDLSFIFKLSRNYKRKVTGHFTNKPAKCVCFD